MSRILYTIFAILFSTSLFAKEVNNFYINGINNSPDQYEFSRFELEKAFTDKYGHVLKNTAVLSAYNESMGFFPDLIESGIQKYNLEHLVSGLSGVGLMSSSAANQILTDVSDQYQRELLAKAVHFHLLLKDADYRNRMYGSVSYVDNSADILLTGAGSLNLPPPTIEEVREFDQLAFLLDLGISLGDLIELKLIIGISSKFEDLTASSQSFYDNMESYIDQQKETEDKLKAEIFPTIESGGAVNVIAHSQGNLFANKILNDFEMPHHTRLLSVGSPSSDLPTMGDFVNLREDAIVRATKPNLGWNYSNIPDHVWDNDIFTSFLIDESELAYVSSQINGDTKGHNFVTAYLKSGSQVREKILDTLAYHYLEIGGNTIPRINNIQGNNVCENPLITLVGETQALEYDVLFYGDRCLFFREDYLTVFNLENHIVESTYDGTYYSPEYEDYNAFRKFVNNLAIIKGNSGLAREFALTLNSSGNVGCTIADNCANGEITTAQQCENMFTALTGVSPRVMNARSNLLSNGICEFRNLNDANIAVMYDSTNGSVEKIDFRDYIEHDRFALEQYVGNNTTPTNVEECKLLWNSSATSRNISQGVGDDYEYQAYYYKGNCYFSSSFNNETIVIDTATGNTQVSVTDSEIVYAINRIEELSDISQQVETLVKARAVLEYNKEALLISGKYYWFLNEINRFNIKEFSHYLLSLDLRLLTSGELKLFMSLLPELTDNSSEKFQSFIDEMNQSITVIFPQPMSNIDTLETKRVAVNQKRLNYFISLKSMYDFNKGKISQVSSNPFFTGLENIFRNYSFLDTLDVSEFHSGELFYFLESLDWELEIYRNEFLYGGYFPGCETQPLPANCWPGIEKLITIDYPSVSSTDAVNQWNSFVSTNIDYFAQAKGLRSLNRSVLENIPVAGYNGYWNLYNTEESMKMEVRDNRFVLNMTNDITKLSDDTLRWLPTFMQSYFPKMESLHSDFMYGGSDCDSSAPIYCSRGIENLIQVVYPSDEVSLSQIQQRKNEVIQKSILLYIKARAIFDYNKVKLQGGPDSNAVQNSIGDLNSLMYRILELQGLNQGNFSINSYKNLHIMWDAYEADVEEAYEDFWNGGKSIWCVIDPNGSSCSKGISNLITVEYPEYF